MFGRLLLVLTFHSFCYLVTGFSNSHYCQKYEEKVEECGVARRRRNGEKKLNETILVHGTELLNRRKRALQVPEPDQLGVDVRRKWPEAYNKPITYMLVNNEFAQKNLGSSIFTFRDLIWNSFNIWSKNTNLRFMEVKSENIAEIKIEFIPQGAGHYGEGTPWEEWCEIFKASEKEDPLSGGLDLSTQTLAHGNFPFGNTWGDESKRYQDAPDGDLHFNADVNWAFEGKESEDGVVAFSIFPVAIHEIGHTLGMPHNEECEDSIMYFEYTDNLKQMTIKNAELHETDVLYIKCLYGEPDPWYKQTENIITLSMVGGLLGLLILYQIFSHVFEVEQNQDWKTKMRGPVIKRPPPNTLIGLLSKGGSKLKQKVTKNGRGNGVQKQFGGSRQQRPGTKLKSMESAIEIEAGDDY